MNRLQRFSVIILAAAIAAAAAGCGSGGSSAPSSLTPSSGKGRVTVSIQFPPPLASRAARSRQALSTGVGNGPPFGASSNSHHPRALPPTNPTYTGAGNGVPIGTQAVKIEILDPGVAVTSASAPLAQSQIITPPTAGSGTPATVTFENIRAGWVWLRATAYANTNATGDPIGYAQTTAAAAGETDSSGRYTGPTPLALAPIPSPGTPGTGTITDPLTYYDQNLTAGTTSTATLVMVPTITSITFGGLPAAGQGNEFFVSTTLYGLYAIANGYNPVEKAASAALIGLPLTWSSGNSTHDGVALSGTPLPGTTLTQASGDGNTCNVTYVSAGPADVQVREANSGLYATAYINPTITVTASYSSVEITPLPTTIGTQANVVLDNTRLSVAITFQDSAGNFLTPNNGSNWISSSVSDSVFGTGANVGIVLPALGPFSVAYTDVSGAILATLYFSVVSGI